MTYEEHVARAMLLGRVYDWRDHTYCIVNANGSYVDDGYMDAQTLLPLSLQECVERLDLNRTGALGRNDVPDDFDPDEFHERLANDTA